MTYDCVIVGARCAGATTARFLGRAGKRVLLLDAGGFPSDQPLSTHFIQPYGMRILDELELGDRVRDIAPAVTTLFNGCDDHVLRLEPPFGGCCPRRIDLDALLLEGAREAGAEVRLHTRVVAIVRDGERVTGVVTEDADGNRQDIRADVVVGADGRSSTIAELVGAEEYYGYDNPRGVYWAYWPRPPWYATDERYCGGAFILYDKLDMVFIFPANRDQLLIGCGFPIDEAAAWKPDPAARLCARLAEHRLAGPLIDGAQPISKTIGLVKARYFFRRAAGPGWALVGDSGLHKDPSPGLGISDALRDAKALAAAIASGGGDPALVRYWRQRDVESIELFHFAKSLGDLTYNNALNRLVFSKAAASADIQARIIDVIERRLSPFDALKVREVLGWTFGALLRGKFGVVRPFLAAGKYNGMVKRELRLRRELLVPPLPPG